MRKKLDRRIVGFIGLIWFIAIVFGLFIRGSAGTGIDYAILNLLHGNEMPALRVIMRGITRTGDPIFYVIANLFLIGFLANRKKWPELLCILAAVLLGWGLNEGMKALFIRTRPVGYALIEQGGFSYPSGHAMVAAAWYPLLAYILQYGHPTRETGAGLLAFYGFFPGLSRLFLGVHYPTDVFFGHLLGLSIAYVCMRAYAMYKRKHNYTDTVTRL